MDNSCINSVCNKLINQNLSISAAESCTAGMFCSMLGDFSGISQSLKESYITYSNDVKMKLLGVSKDTIDTFTEVSSKCALEMAEGLHKATGSDVCISVTGYAGPGGGTFDNPVGTVFIGLCYQGDLKVKELHIDNLGREYIRKRATLEMFKMIDENI